MERKALGKGLSALIPEKAETVSTEDFSGFVATSQIRPNPRQPRERFDDKKLNDLIQSIRDKGLIQPILVRKKDSHFELIAGERRYRAAQAAGLEKIPAIVKDVDDSEALSISLIENIQREELNPIEEARAFQRLIDEHGFSHDDVAKAVGKERATITNALRLLGLPSRAQKMVADGHISMGHARALLGLTGEHTICKFAERIIQDGLSVRETEKIVNRRKHPSGSASTSKIGDHKVMYIEEELQKLFGTKVIITHRKKRGKIQITYYSMDDLERIYHFVSKLTKK